jgi:transcriptional regulator with XRE-family HTH domain
MKEGKEKEICLEIKAYLARKGITIKEAAALLGGTPQTVTSQLSGRTFGRNSARRYAEVFGFSETYLMTGEGQLVAGDPAEGDAPQASAQEKVERLLATIESQQRTIEILAHKLG